MRKFSHLLHLWLGLVAAVFLLVEGATGAVMAWGPEIIRMLNPQTRQPDPGYRVAPAAPRLPLATLAARLNEAHAPNRVRIIRFAAQPGAAWIAELESNTGTSARVWFDPATGATLGIRATTLQPAWLQRFVRGAGGLHGDFPAAVAFLLIGASGLILWWPRQMYRVRWPPSLARTNLELHATIGFYGSVLLFIFASTAVIMTQQRPALRFVSWLTQTPLPPPIAQPPRAPTPVTAPLDLDQAYALATATRTDGSFVGLQWVNEAADLVAFQFRSAELNGRILVEMKSGRVREVLDRKNLTAPERFVRVWVRQVHAGEIYGAVSRWIAGACGLLLAVLAVTGPMIYYLRRRAAAAGAPHG